MNMLNLMTDAFPKEIIFERDFYIGELYEQMKKGMIRFPYGEYEKSCLVNRTLCKYGN